MQQVIRPTGLLDPEIEVRPVNTQVDDLLSEINKRTVKNQRVLVTTLTKKMAEDLTDYLSEQDVRVRYLHSDVDTVERVEILRDLRLGAFDVLVGINLLREGLDLPEVSLVAILDADKEGFLRSERSLIQTVGRAARNAQGRAIMYADKITESMQLTIDITDKRRLIQQAYNKAHHITPQTISKQVNDIMEATQDNKPDQGNLAVAEQRTAYQVLSPKQLTKEINRLERQMYQYARDLQFEQAAQLRDQIDQLRQQMTQY